MIDLKTQYGGLSLRNPIIIGSCGLTGSAEKIREFEKAGAGAVVLKSLFEEQIEMQTDRPRHPEEISEAPDAAGQPERTNPVTDYLELIKQSKAQCSIPIIASIHCYKADSWIDFAHQVELAGADALELNIYFLTTKPEQDTAYAESLYCTIVRKVKETVQIPVFVKISKYYTNIPALVSSLKASGADGVVLFNRFYQPDIDINTKQMVSGNVFSSHSDLSETIRWTAFTSGRVPGIPISSSTGILDWEDVVKCILAGGTTVQLCSAIYTHGSEVIGQMLTCIEEWMLHTGYETLSRFRGKLSLPADIDSSVFERQQFLKYFSERD